MEGRWRQSYCGPVISGKTVCVKVKYSDFSQATRSKTVASNARDGRFGSLGVADLLLSSVYPFKLGVRLVGVALSWLKVQEDSSTRARHLKRAASAIPPKRKSLPREEVRQAFRKEPNSDWEEECRCSYRRPWEEEWAV